MGKQVVGFIPARAGSKGILGKNIKMLAGKPLVCYAIDAAIVASVIDVVVLSTDSEEIKTVVSNYYPEQKKLLLFDRAPDTATDAASTESAMLDFIKRSDFKFNDIVLIQATSPLITASDIDKGYKHYKINKLGGLVSVCRQKRFLWGTMSPQNYDPQDRPRRQETEGHMVENGAFYITSVKNLLKSGCRISKPYGTYEMHENTYFEVDEPEDWIIMEGLLRKKQREQKIEKLPKQIDAVVFDFDGVFTNNKVIVFQGGEEAVLCDRGDGFGIEMLKKQGVKVWVISKEKNPVLLARCKKLKMDCYHGVDEKWPLLKKQLAIKEIHPENIIYVGNDINDMECVENAGCGVVVNDAHPDLIQKADIVLKHDGGSGAIRELADLIEVFAKRNS